jgi:dephospho-CoA kinase
MYKLGITGGIASGKSTAASYLKNQNKNSYVFNADRESKKHLKSSHSLQQKIINVFGNRIVRNNKIDLQLLAKNAFNNEINHKILNGIMWPEIFILISNKYDELKDANINLFIVDAALIFEANYMHFFDSTLLIKASKNKRIDRAIERKNLPLESIQNRILLQMSDKEKTELANHSIINNASLNNFYKKIDVFYKNLRLSQK